MSETLSTNIFETADNSFDVMQPVIFPDRGTHAPGWYVRHEKPASILVKHRGKPIPPGFSVAEVAPEYRWAIQADGEVMDQLDFMQKHELWWGESYSIKGGQIPDPSCRHIPKVERFVARRVSRTDPTHTEYIRREANEKPQILVQYDSDGKNPQPAVEEIIGKDGKPDYELADAPPEEIADKVKAARANLRSDNVDKLLAAEEYDTTRCGQEMLKSKMAAHVRWHCQECRDIKAKEDEKAKDRKRKRNTGRWEQ